MSPKTRIPTALLLCLAWTAGAVAAAGDERPDLGGHWRMDRELSEDPSEKMGEGRGVGGPGRGGPEGRFGDGFRQGPGRRGAGPGASREEMRKRTEETGRGLESFHILQTDSSVRFAFADGRQHDLRTDNKWRTVAAASGEMQIKARWQGGALVLRKKGRHGQATETYYVTGDGSLLTVVVEMEAPGPAGSVSFKRVYRPDEPAGEGPRVSD